MGVKSYKDLLIWKKGIELVKAVYLLTRGFPPEEKFGLMSQMRRAAVSVPSNIAEGQSRKSKNEFIQMLSIAQGSLAELETQLVISKELGFCDGKGWDVVSSHIYELQKMMSALRTKLGTSGREDL
jgi:four helix bundle protein